MRYIFAADLHLDQRPQNAYRWGIFDWFEEQIKQYNVRYLFVLGDITDSKNRHDNEFIVKLAESFRRLETSTDINIFLLMGNHCYTNPDYPVYRFFNCGINNIHCIHKIQELPFLHSYILMLPHTPTPQWDWKGLDFNKYDLILCHQTFDGSRMSNGHIMEGVKTRIFKNTNARIYSGDVHNQQKVGNVEYVGAPYPINFGDEYEARCILFDELEDTVMDLHFPTIRKSILCIKDAKEIYKADNKAGDQVKVRLKLPRSEFVDWAKYKREVAAICKEREFNLFGIELEEAEDTHAQSEEGNEAKEKSIDMGLSSLEAYDAYCEKENIRGSIYRVGRQILES